jgi:hypothetical protein
VSDRSTAVSKEISFSSPHIASTNIAVRQRYVTTFDFYRKARWSKCGIGSVYNRHCNEMAHSNKGSGLSEVWQNAVWLPVFQGTGVDLSRFISYVRTRLYYFCLLFRKSCIRPSDQGRLHWFGIFMVILRILKVWDINLKHLTYTFFPVC